MKYLVCVDESAHAKKAFEMVLRLVKPEDSILLIHVGIFRTPLVESDASRKEKQQVQMNVDRLVTDFLMLSKKCGVGTFDGVCALREDPRDYIVEMARLHAIDCIVVGARGMSPIAGLLLGSVSDFIVHHAKCSVLIAK